MSEQYFEVDAERHSGFVVEEYQGKYSLTSARTYQGEVKKSWCKPQFGKEYSEKAIPIKVPIRGTREDAIANLLLILDDLGYKAGQKPDDSDIPF